MTIKDKLIVSGGVITLLMLAILALILFSFASLLKGFDEIVIQADTSANNAQLTQEQPRTICCMPNATIATKHRIARRRTVFIREQ